MRCPKAAQTLRGVFVHFEVWYNNISTADCSGAGIVLVFVAHSNTLVYTWYDASYFSLVLPSEHEGRLAPHFNELPDSPTQKPVFVVVSTAVHCTHAAVTTYIIWFVPGT